jgi:hypothetical protein
MRSAAFPGGGGANVQPLAAQPMVVAVDLNEWVRFDQPGEYRVTVHSRRAGVRIQSSQRINAVSNELRVTLVPASPEWQQQTLQNALAGLNNPATRVTAAKTLRYLGTEAAAREMAHYTQDPDCRLGVIGSPFRSAAVQEMRKLLRDPGTSIDHQFLDTLTLLSIPDTPGNHTQDFTQISSHLQEELLQAISLKRGEALMASVRTAMESPHAAEPEVRQALTDVLLANFDSLSPMQQSELVRNPATVLERPLLVPLLRKMAERYQEFAQPQSPEAVTANQIAGEALLEWYSADPVNARPAILREILRPQPRFSVDVLGILPDQELAEAEQPLVAHFEAATDRFALRNLAALIARYAGASEESKLLGHLDRDLAAGLCDTQAPLLAWLLRVDPERARRRLEMPSGACRLSLAEVGKLQPGPLVEGLAIRALDGPDGFAIADATAYLTDYGSAGAEDALWSHFADWSKRWTGHESQLSVSAPDVRVGQSLMQALIMGSGWIVSDAKFLRMADLALLPGQRQQITQYMQIWRSRPWLLRSAGLGQYQIGWYRALSIDAAKKKLQQFPRGSEFRWIAQGLPTDSAVFKELAQFAALHGCKIW